MAQNQALIIANLKDILFSEEEISKSVERIHIFELKDKNKNSLGFTSSFDLKSFIFDNGDDACDFEVKNIDSNEWTPLFEHPTFQRRKPQLVPLSNLANESDIQFYILKNGQKNGPYEKFELMTMIDEKELLLTDMVTTNGGLTWIKLFHVDNFERRILKDSDQLPGVPNPEVMAYLDSVTPNIPSVEAISSLAYLSNVKRGKTQALDKVDKIQAARQNSSTVYKWLLLGSIIGIVFFAYKLKDQLASPFNNEAASIGEQAEMLTPVDMNESVPTPGNNNSNRNTVGEKRELNQINDTQRNAGKFEPRALNPIRPTVKKSFMDTSNYQDTANQNDAPEDPNYFYDSNSAMELDPVRSQVSKENYDDIAAQAEGPIPSSDNLFENEIPSAP